MKATWGSRNSKRSRGSLRAPGIQPTKAAEFKIIFSFLFCLQHLGFDEHRLAFFSAVWSMVSSSVLVRLDRVYRECLGQAPVSPGPPAHLEGTLLKAVSNGRSPGRPFPSHSA